MNNLEIYEWNENGYKPLVFYNGWQVALLNWEPAYELANAGEIERHVNTDEVFVLWKGHGLLFSSSADGFQVEDMRPGVIYNVPKSVWHGLLATRDAAWIIVEDRDTHLKDTEIRQMSTGEWKQLKANLPVWVNS